MDRGRNLEALTEDAEEEEMEERKGSSDDSDSDDEEPDPSARREPNKFDNLCDGVANAMALMHVSLQELLEMKDEMLKHSLPPPLLIKLATITGKVFRSVSDLNMPVNELVRLVRVYSTPWEEKSAALKKLHEDYESKQRQLNIAVKRLQLVDAHSKRIAREKRIMNWEKLFAKIMSNKGHGRRWKFLIETIKQKAKLGLEHVQEYTKQLEESSDEEEEDDDDMPMTVKGRGEGSDKLSDLEEGEEDEEKASGTQEKVSTEDDEENIDIEEIEEEPRQGSPKKVRFAAPEEPPKDVYVKPPMEDASIGTSDTDYDHYLFIRVYKPSKIEETELKCTITFGEQIKKTKRLDIPLEDIPETGMEEAKPKGKGLIGLRAKAPVVEDKTAEYKKEAQLRRAEQIYKTKYEELQFDINQYFGQDHIWRAGKKDEPQELKISMHTGQLEEMFAMATVDFGDLKELDLKTVYLPEPHGDDDVPKPPGDDSESVISEEIDILLPDEDTATEYKPPVEKYEVLKKVEPAHFPIYYLNPKSNNVHEPAGMLPLVIYLGRKAKPPVWNRQCGTMTFNDLMFDVAGIDITTWKREDMFKETQSRAASAMEWQPEVQVKVVEKEVIKEVIVQQDPVIVEVEKKPEPVKTPEPVKAKTPEPVKAKTPEPVKEKTPEPVEPLEEMVTKSEYNQLALKHSEELQLVQSEYEKRLQELLDNLQQMQQAQLEQKQQLQSHSRPPLVHQRPVSSSSRHSSAKSEKRTETNTLTPATVPMLTPQNKLTTQVPTIPDSQPPIVHPPETDNMNGSLSEQRLFTKRRHKLGKPLPAPLAPGVPEDFLSRLAWFEESSKRHQEEVYERTIRQVKEDIEKKLAGQHKLSKKEEEIYDAMKDVSLPALFMPTKMNAVFNPRAHQYFHPTGSTDMRLTQPPSVFQLPPLPHKTRMSVVNLFDLSRNFNRKGQQWLMDRYIQQQEPVANVHGTVPQTPAPTVAPQVGQSNPQTPQNDSQTSLHGTINQGKKLDAEM